MATQEQTSRKKDLVKHMRPGKIYRRVDLQPFFKSLDKDLRHLVATGELRKVSRGLYYRPCETRFGKVPVEQNELLKSYLGTGEFLVVSLNHYNALGVGTTQLYSEDLVYNHKRAGRIVLDSRKYYFLRSRRFPNKVTKEFLYVDLMNNLHFLAEDTGAIKRRLAKNLSGAELKKVRRSADRYGKASTRKFFAGI